MGEGKEKARNGRLDREAYFNAAFKILATAGFQELTVDNLSAELGATKGSFYHHFAGMPEFTEALVAAWEATVSEIFTQLAALPPTEGLTRSVDMVVQWPLRADAALRAWAWANPRVAAAVRHQEATWERLLVNWLGPFVEDTERCRLLAKLTLSVFAGLFQLQERPDAELVRAICLEIIRNNVGIELLPDGTHRPLDRTIGPSPEPA